jgi:hypothetical protein
MADYGATTPREQGPDLDADSRLDLVYRRWQDARDGLSMWRDEARECYDFVRRAAMVR